jgi:predicted RNase H-like HicB family nuclease
MSNYAIVIEATDTGFSAYAPDLPGCVAVGQSVGETLDEMAGAIGFHVDGLRERGEQVPEPTWTVTR